MGMKRIAGVFLTLFLLIGYGLSHSQMNAQRAARPKETLRAQALAIDPTLLKIASGPFKGLAADYFLLKASVFMGGAWEVTEEDWEAVYILLKQSLHLDPLFFQTGYYVQGMLSWRSGFHEKAIELLELHAKQRSWDWEPQFYLGFNYFYYLKEYEKAASHMQAAAQLPGAPPIAATLAARIVQKGGQTLTAIGFLKTMVERADDDFNRKLLEKRLLLFLGLHQIEKARDAYLKQYGRLPESMDELIENGFIDQFPSELKLEAYSYDAGSGAVTLK